MKSPYALDRGRTTYLYEATGGEVVGADEERWEDRIEVDVRTGIAYLRETSEPLFIDELSPWRRR